MIVSASYPPVLGGVQTVVSKLAGFLDKNGLAVRVVTHRHPRSLPKAELIDGVPVDRLLFISPQWDQLLSPRIRLFIAGIFFSVVTKWRLRKIMADFRPDVVNFHFPTNQVPFVKGLAKEFDFGLVVSLHGDDVGRCFRKGGALQRRRLRQILFEADAVTACSAALLRQAAEVYPGIEGKGRVVHNGFDPERFEIRETYENPRPYLLAYGRLTPKKGFDLLIRAFARSGLGTMYDLLIAGSGEEAANLEALAAERGVAGSVRLLGRASPEEVVRLLNGCVAGVIPSREEPFGIVALEMLASGKPVVATRVGGLTEIFGFFPETDFPVRLVEPDVEPLAAGLALATETAEDPQHSERQRIRVREQFAWETGLAAYRAVLEGREL